MAVRDMDISKHSAVWRLCAVLVVLVSVETQALAGADEASCELKIQGHSIVRLMLIEKTRTSGVQFDNPGESVQLPAGEYRVEVVELEEGYAIYPGVGRRHDWFKVTPAGPNELVVGAPLYPTATVTRYGGYLQLNYDTVDGAGRSYTKTPDYGSETPPPTFTVYKDGHEIGSGSFEYG
jgi:hypothetical protein